MIITIPTGNRTGKAFNTVRKWKQRGISVVAYVWDTKTFGLLKNRCYRIYQGERKLFSILQNLLIKSLADVDWKGIICGADDLWPGEGVELLEKVCIENDGKVLWVFDGLNKSVNTHPVITRGWYDKYKVVFDKQFHHNCCDNDLMIRNCLKNELIKIEGITFDHQHPLHTPLAKRDSIYRLGYSFLNQDRKYLDDKYKNTNVKGICRKVRTIKV